MATVTTIENLDEQGDGDKSAVSTLHFIPASVKDSGEQKVDAYFKTSIEAENDDRHLTATLRGRPLDGHELKLPSGMVCAVARSGRSHGLGEHRDKVNMRVVKKTDGFVYWNYDKKPSQHDALKMALAHLDVAKVMHQ